MKHMTTGERIKKRRLELGLSQEELAKRLGNKSRASVCTVEKDKEDLTTDRIRKYAEALETTPAYIMGWDDPVETFDTPEQFEKHWNAIGGGRHPLELSDLEHTLVVNFRASDPVTQNNVLKLLDIEKKGCKYIRRIK